MDEELDEESRISQAYSSLKERYMVLKIAAPNAVKNLHRVAVLMDRLSTADEYVRELEATLKKKNQIIEDLKRMKMVEVPMTDGAILIQVEGKVPSQFVPQATHMIMVEKMKQWKLAYEEVVAQLRVNDN